MEVECALLDGEQESEMAQLQKENEFLNQLKGRMPSSEKLSHLEKTQVKIFQLFHILLCAHFMGRLFCLLLRFLRHKTHQ